MAASRDQALQMENEANISIYRAARTIKRRQNTLYNALRSIYDDSIFVGEISQLWPQLPLLANLRCGLWYSSKFHSTCYFKSTDGHTNNWSFNTSRLNLHVALLAGMVSSLFFFKLITSNKCEDLKLIFFYLFECEWVGQKGGCIIVDSTRKGKRFPDSMSKTIPIWTCVLNRSVYKYRKKMCNGGVVLAKGVSAGNVLSFISYLFPFTTLCENCLTLLSLDLNLL